MTNKKGDKKGNKRNGHSDQQEGRQEGTQKGTEGRQGRSAVTSKKEPRPETKGDRRETRQRQ